MDFIILMNLELFFNYFEGFIVDVLKIFIEGKIISKVFEVFCYVAQDVEYHLSKLCIFFIFKYRQVTYKEEFPIIIILVNQ